MSALWKELTATRERALAWGFRALLMIAIALVSIIGFFINRTLSEFDASNGRLWQAVEKMTDSSQRARDEIHSLTGRIDLQVETVSRINNELQDHEMRIRTLERPPH